jgi:hypothetical protein
MKKLCTIALCFALLALAACSDNLFGSSSGGSNCGEDIKCLRTDAENAFRKGDYKGSYNFCEKIVKIDSTVSFGYYGMAKASLWQHDVTPLSVFSLVKLGEDECPFMGKDVRVQNNYFQAMKKIVPVLSALDRRDSLTALYELYMQAKKNGESLDERLSWFKNTYCKDQDCKDTTNKKESFPLSDREYKSSYFGGILLLSTFSKWFLGFFDNSEDGCIARRGERGKDNPGDQWEKWGCEKADFDYDLSLSLKCSKDKTTGKMSVTIDSKQILDELQEELDKYYERVSNCTAEKCNDSVPNEIGNLNETIDNFGGKDFKEVEDVLNGLGLAGSDDLGEDQKSLKDEIEKYKAYAAFYKMGTHRDEDGDGCIDEELLDGQDNDGDGFINENSRLAPTDREHPFYGISSINNSMYGDNLYKDDENWEYNKPVSFNHPVRICNAPDCSIFTDLPVNEEGWVTVINFTQLGYPDGSKYWTTRDMDLKLKVAQDTNCLEYNLEYRKNNIGGCWPYYDEPKFDRYCRGYN